MTSLSNVVSLTQTQEGYLKTVTKALTRMSELTMLAQDSTKGSADLELYQKEFNQLNELVYNTQDKKFTGIFMFKSLTNNAQHTSVTVDEYGGQFKIPPVDFSTAKFTEAIAAPGSERSISTTAEAQITSEKNKGPAGAYSSRTHWSRGYPIACRIYLGPSIHFQGEFKQSQKSDY